MKSLLVLTPRFPYPVVGGDRLRIYQVCKALSAEFRLSLLSLCESDAEMKHPVPKDGVFHRVDRVKLPRWRSWLQCLYALPTSRPLQVAYYRSADFERRVQASLREHDGVLAHLIRSADVLRTHDGPKFLEMTDAISLNYGRVRQHDDGRREFRTLVFRIEADRLARYERRIVDDFDLSFLVSEIDRRYLFAGDPQRLRKVMVCSNGVDLTNLPFEFAPDGRDIIFIGNLTTLQNLDAALHMAADILPLVRLHRPTSRFRIVGRIRPRDAAMLARFPGVDVSGEVPDIATAARGGAVGVCPIRLGAGVQNKVLEYLALGLPVVSTPIGLEGFDARPGKHLMVAEGAQQFADTVLALLDRREVARKLAVAGRRYVEEGHSWSAMLQPMVNAIRERMDGDGRVANTGARVARHQPWSA